jgi:rubrerythrin
MPLEQIRTEQPVKNTVHNLVQTLSVKLDSAARYGLYREDATKDGFHDCADVFARLSDREQESIEDLVQCLREHIDEAEVRH